jgi:hypothetical protein
MTSPGSRVQAGGDVVTAYAPDTAVDFLLLRHQPRFDYYANFFRVLAAVSGRRSRGRPPRRFPCGPLRSMRDSSPCKAARCAGK